MILSSSAMSSSSRVMVTRCIRLPGLRVRVGGHGPCLSYQPALRTWLCHGSGAQGRQVEALHLAQQLDESPGAMRQRGFALLRGRLAGVAHRAGGMQVLSHPAETCRFGGVEPVEVFFQRER